MQGLERSGWGEGLGVGGVFSSKWDVSWRRVLQRRVTHLTTGRVCFSQLHSSQLCSKVQGPSLGSAAHDLPRLCWGLNTQGQVAKTELVSILVAQGCTGLPGFTGAHHICAQRDHVHIMSISGARAASRSLRSMPLFIKGICCQWCYMWPEIIVLLNIFSTVRTTSEDGLLLSSKSQSFCLWMIVQSLFSNVYKEN